MGSKRKPVFSFFPWEEIGAGNADSTYFYDTGEHLTIGEQERVTVVCLHFMLYGKRELEMRSFICDFLKSE